MELLYYIVVLTTKPSFYLYFVALMFLHGCQIEISKKHFIDFFIILPAYMNFIHVYLILFLKEK